MVLAFFGVVAIWAVSKCSAQKSVSERHSRFAEDDQEERPTKRDSSKAEQPVTPDPSTQPPVNALKSTTLPPPPPPSATTVAPKTPGKLPVLGASPVQQTAANPVAATKTETPNYTTLYVSIDGLNMRKTPGLKGALITKLALYEPVYFLNKKSDKQEEISLGQEKVTDYWVKVRTKSGKEGWVFGAGVHFYKTKRKGVQE